MSMTRLVPARFALYEFDDRDQPAGPVRRWLNHWDGALGQPAEEVTLAWSVDDAVVLVCTSGRDYADADALAVSALAGPTWPWEATHCRSPTNPRTLPTPCARWNVSARHTKLGPSPKPPTCNSRPRRHPSS